MSKWLLSIVNLTLAYFGLYSQNLFLTQRISYFDSLEKVQTVTLILKREIKKDTSVLLYQSDYKSIKKGNPININDFESGVEFVFSILLTDNTWLKGPFCPIISCKRVGPIKKYKIRKGTIIHYGIPIICLNAAEQSLKQYNVTKGTEAKYKKFQLAVIFPDKSIKRFEIDP